MILTVRGRAYRAAVIKEMERQGLSGEFLSGDLEVHITLNPPTLRRYDCDNFAKSLLDALTHAGFWIDDSQIQILTIKKGLKVAGGGVDVKVSLLSGD
jgi:crossover junction endodeoxyribonuclease RusA